MQFVQLNLHTCGTVNNMNFSKLLRYYWYKLTLPDRGAFTLSGPEGYLRYCSTTGTAQYTENKLNTESATTKWEALIYFKHMDFDKIHYFKNYQSFCSGFRDYPVWPRK